MLVGQNPAVGEDQTVAVNPCALSLAKLAGHLGEGVHAVVVSGSAERGETTEKCERGSVRKCQMVFCDFRYDGKATWGC